MRLGMMQPYFFPYLGYYSLIAATDRFVVFDTAQYIRRGWVNRNRVLSTGGSDWKYVRVPVVRTDRDSAIRDIRIDSTQNWQLDLLRSLDVYDNRRAGYFAETMEFLEATLNAGTDSLSELLVHCLKQTCDLIGLKIRCDVFSQMDLPLPRVIDPGGWALEVAKATDAKAYVNPPGGREIFSRADFQSADIELQFLTHRLPAYDQRQADFVPGLSIIDVLMWNGTEMTRRMIDQYDLAP